MSIQRKPYSLKTTCGIASLLLEKEKAYIAGNSKVPCVLHHDGREKVIDFMLDHFLNAGACTVEIVLLSCWTTLLLTDASPCILEISPLSCWTMVTYASPCILEVITVFITLMFADASLCILEISTLSCWTTSMFADASPSIVDHAATP
jgi:hypothetical protein